MSVYGVFLTKKENVTSNFEVNNKIHPKYLLLRKNVMNVKDVPKNKLNLKRKLNYCYESDLHYS